jgi:hypothetical protein
VDRPAQDVATMIVWVAVALWQLAALFSVLMVDPD